MHISPAPRTRRFQTEIDNKARMKFLLINHRFLHEESPDGTVTHHTRNCTNPCWVAGLHWYYIVVLIDRKGVSFESFPCLTILDLNKDSIITRPHPLLSPIHPPVILSRPRLSSQAQLLSVSRRRYGIHSQAFGPQATPGSAAESRIG